MAFPLATASGGVFASAFRRPRALPREPSESRARASPRVSRDRRPRARTRVFEPSCRARGGALPVPAAATLPRARVVTRAFDAEDDLESARYEAEAAARAAADAEARLDAFRRSQPASLLDQAAADAETKRSAATRAADAASRARADADRFARAADAAAKRAAAIADSEACTYLSEARKKPADCVERAAAAEAESRVARAAAIAAATEHAVAAEKLVAERAARAERAERAAAAAAAEAAAAERRSRSDARRSPPLSPSAERMNDIVPASVPAGTPTMSRETPPRASAASAVYHPPSGRGSPDAAELRTSDVAKTSFATNFDDGDAAARAEVTPDPDAERSIRRGRSEETNDAASRSAFADRVAAATGGVPEATPEASGPGTAGATRAAGAAGAAEATTSTRRARPRPSGEGSPATRSRPCLSGRTPRRLDAIPAFFGRLNPITGFLVYYTGAVLREATGAPLVALQWTFLVLIPALAAQCAIRLWAHRRRAERAAAAAASRGETHEETFDFYRANRPAWLDVHLGYALLCPAGAVGGDGASWWLLLPPAFMLFRFVGHRFDAMRPVRRAVAVVGGCVALAGLCFSASGALTQAIGSLRAAPPALAVVLAPVAFGLTYAFYLAPAALLPGAVARAWRGEGFDKPRDSTANAPKPMTPEEEAKEKANKRFWTLAGVAAMAVSLATGSDAPVFVVFFAQLFKADPSKLMQVMIDKGDPSRAEFDDTIAEGAARLFRRERKDGDRRDDERGSDDAEKPKIA